MVFPNLALEVNKGLVETCSVNGGRSSLEGSRSMEGRSCRCCSEGRSSMEGSTTLEGRNSPEGRSSLEGRNTLEGRSSCVSKGSLSMGNGWVQMGEVLALTIEALVGDLVSGSSSH